MNKIFEFVITNEDFENFKRLDFTSPDLENEADSKSWFEKLSCRPWNVTFEKIKKVDRDTFMFNKDC